MLLFFSTLCAFICTIKLCNSCRCAGALQIETENDVHKIKSSVFSVSPIKPEQGELHAKHSNV